MDLDLHIFSIAAIAHIAIRAIALRAIDIYAIATTDVDLVT
jgi:hypothetical protein